jgi:hypothetical protein
VFWEENGRFQKPERKNREKEEYAGRKNLYADDSEENEAGRTDMFRPPILLHLGIAADSTSYPPCTNGCVNLT